MIKKNEIKYLINDNFVDLTNYKAFEKLRDCQEDTIFKIIDAFNKGKKYFILEAPTGIGKSGIALSIANYYSDIANIKWNVGDKKIGTHIIVHQKILQDQYINEKWFSNNNIDNIKSAENYTCNQIKHLNTTCAEVAKFRKNSKSSICFKSCLYNIAREKFYEGKIGLTNIQYYLTASSHSKYFKPKNIIIVDEAHTIEDNILNFISFDISEWMCNTKFKIQIPKLEKDNEIVDWTIGEFLDTLDNLRAEIKDKLSNFSDDKNYTQEEMQDFKGNISNLENIEKYIYKIKIISQDYDKDTWVIDRNRTKTNLRTFSFKPIFINKYSNNILFNKGNKFLLMSATILNKNSYCNSIGINENEVEFLSLDSLFNASKRPVYYTPVGKMAKDSLQQTLPNLAKAVSLILEKYENKKGIIHCHTYEIADYLKNNVDKKHSSRLVSHTNENRDKALEFHINSKKATVLLSPSMSEGVDLKDSLSRFQIMCKVPFPYLGDRRIMQKKKLQPWWYPYQTAKIIIQGLGRSIRNENDYADSFIMDSNWAFFLKLNRKYFPKWFLDSLKH